MPAIPRNYYLDNLLSYAIMSVLFNPVIAGIDD